jgi:hypothetical protein
MSSSSEIKSFNPDIIIVKPRQGITPVNLPQDDDDLGFDDHSNNTNLHSTFGLNVPIQNMKACSVYQCQGGTTISEEGINDAENGL